MCDTEASGDAEELVQLRRHEEAPHQGSHYSGHHVVQEFDDREEAFTPHIWAIKEQSQGESENDHNGNFDDTEVYYSANSLPEYSQVEYRPVIG